MYAIFPRIESLLDFSVRSNTYLFGEKVILRYVVICCAIFQKSKFSHCLIHSASNYLISSKWKTTSKPADSLYLQSGKQVACQWIWVIRLNFLWTLNSLFTTQFKLLHISSNSSKFYSLIIIYSHISLSEFCHKVDRLSWFLVFWDTCFPCLAHIWPSCLVNLSYFIMLLLFLC